MGTDDGKSTDDWVGRDDDDEGTDDGVGRDDTGGASDAVGSAAAYSSQKPERSEQNRRSRPRHSGWTADSPGPPATVRTSSTAAPDAETLRCPTRTRQASQGMSG